MLRLGHICVCARCAHLRYTLQLCVMFDFRNTFVTVSWCSFQRGLRVLYRDSCFIVRVRDLLPVFFPAMELSTALSQFELKTRKYI